MRKSYQGHIKDIPGKNLIKPDSIIRDILRVPEGEVDTYVGPKNIRRLERETLLEGFNIMPGVIPDVCWGFACYMMLTFGCSLIRVCWGWMTI